MPLVAPDFPLLVLTHWPIRKTDLHSFLNSPIYTNSCNSDQDLL